MDLNPAEIEADGDLIKITSYLGEHFWYRPLPDGTLQLGTPYTVWHGKTQVKVFIPTVLGIPMQVPVILGIEAPPNADA